MLDPRSSGVKNEEGGALGRCVITRSRTFRI